jgi:hypothetical protein
MLHGRYLDTDALKFFIGDVLSPWFYRDLVVCVCAKPLYIAHKRFPNDKKKKSTNIETEI